ncbi:MAG TPA: CGNR zinc finger domain-containing protein [Woeseiaceae bacterium]
MVNMSDEHRRVENLEAVGGHLAIDFVNTVEYWRGQQHGFDYLENFEALLRWHRLADVIGARDARLLSSGGQPAQAETHRQAIQLRATLHGILDALANRQSPSAGLLDRFNSDANRIIRETVAWRRLKAQGRDFSVKWDFNNAPPQALLGPLVWQSLELLEHGRLDRIKACPVAEGCGWLFLDLSKNRSRTWCSMKTCGNTAKVRRFRARH